MPFLEDEGDVAIGEAVAPRLDLAQRYRPTPLRPFDAALIVRVLPLTVASAASLRGLMNPMMASRFGAPSDQSARWINHDRRARAEEFLVYAESVLAGREYVVGDAFS